MPTVDERIRAAIVGYLEHSGKDRDRAHEIYAEDAVLEFPQSGERFVGKRNFLEWRRAYPADVEFAVRRIRGGGNLWVAEVSVRYDGGEWQFGVSILEFRDGSVVHETIYGAPVWEAPDWRAPWRAAEPASAS
jgi:hypothetical protein